MMGDFGIAISLRLSIVYDLTLSHLLGKYGPMMNNRNNKDTPIIWVTSHELKTGSLIGAVNKGKSLFQQD